jgi:hypothetical protein
MYVCSLRILYNHNALAEKMKYSENKTHITVHSNESMYIMTKKKKEICSLLFLADHFLGSTIAALSSPHTFLKISLQIHGRTHARRSLPKHRVSDRGTMQQYPCKVGL